MHGAGGYRPVQGEKLLIADRARHLHRRADIGQAAVIEIPAFGHLRGHQRGWAEVLHLRRISCLKGHLNATTRLPENRAGEEHHPPATSAGATLDGTGGIRLTGDCTNYSPASNSTLFRLNIRTCIPAPLSSTSDR